MFSFTLEKGDSPFIHPFSTQTSLRFTLQKGFFLFEDEYVHPFRRVNVFTFLRIHFHFPEVHSPFEKGDSPLKKGEWKGE
jgi:hypothetical protein